MAFYSFDRFEGALNRKVDIFGKNWFPRQTTISSGSVVVIFILKQLFLRLYYENYSTLISTNPKIIWKHSSNTLQLEDTEEASGHDTYTSPSKMEIQMSQTTN